MINSGLNNYQLKIFFAISLCLYLVALVWVLFFQVGTTDRDTYFVNPDDHMLPFHSTFEMFKKYFTYRYTPHGGEFRDIFLMNILGNLVLLMPWGFLAPLVFSKLNTLKKVAISGFLISFSAEVIQFVFTLGIADVDDLMYNTVGAIAGYYVLQITKYLLWKAKAISLDNLHDEKLNRKGI
ncbi:MAG: VanZ family protein [Adhaeribacter sp.]